ncbi:putative amidoligase enzyme-domain-containing protein [Ustulina deusta]|nr:putative amidoligase enzyme-domain-containing protein [Ustulina deusta]
MASIPKIDEMIEALDDSNGTLTCGVEFEFLLPSIHYMAKDPDPDIKNKRLYKSTSGDPEDIKTEVREQLLETLQQLDGIPFRAMDDDNFHPPHDNVVIYDSWRLGGDGTVNKHGAEGPYNWTNCELTSPVMGSHDYGTKIEDVCRVLQAVRIHLNKSTAVHIHVGRGNEPFSLLTVKKFATLYWLTEKAIFELHHPSRHDNRCCLSLTNYSVLAIKSQAALDVEGRNLGDGGPTMEDYVPGASLTQLRRAQLRCIWDCGSIEERGSVGFLRFLPAGKTGGNIQTFEWRQMSGSVDANHINQWAKACIAFTDFCRLSNKATFKKLIGEVIEKENYTGIELLEALDVDTCIFKDMREIWRIAFVLSLSYDEI